MTSLGMAKTSNTKQIFRVTKQNTNGKCDNSFCFY